MVGHDHNGHLVPDPPLPPVDLSSLRFDHFIILEDMIWTDIIMRNEI